MTKLVRPQVCAECAKQKANWDRAEALDRPVIARPRTYPYCGVVGPSFRK